VAITSDYTMQELIAMTDKLVKKLCCYGGGSFCDCKYLKDGDKPSKDWGEENTGCCEARTLRWQLKKRLRKIENPHDCGPGCQYCADWEADKREPEPR
jgi:hypothetical protein